MSNIEFEKCKDKEIKDKCEVIAAMTDEIAELRETLKEMMDELTYFYSHEYLELRNEDCHSKNLERLARFSKLLNK